MPTGDDLCRGSLEIVLRGRREGDQLRIEVVREGPSPAGSPAGSGMTGGPGSGPITGSEERITTLYSGDVEVRPGEGPGAGESYVVRLPLELAPATDG